MSDIAKGQCTDSVDAHLNAQMHTTTPTTYIVGRPQPLFTHVRPLTDIERDFDTFNRVYREYFPGDGPCRTTVEVNRLPTPIAIELKCIATL